MVTNVYDVTSGSIRYTYYLFCPIYRSEDYPDPRSCQWSSNMNCSDMISISGNRSPGGWINSGMNQAFVTFESDSVVTRSGFKINLQCQPPSMTTPTIQPITTTTWSSWSTTTANNMSASFGCQLYQDNTTGLTIFETSTPYSNNLNCQEEFSCSGYGESVHFEFIYFQTESDFDYLYVINDIEDELFNYSGAAPVNTWINTGDGHVNLHFFSDGSVTDVGFKMNLKCLNTVSTITLNLTASIVTAFEYTGMR